MNKLLNHIFKDWTLEEFTGLLFALIALIAATTLIAAIGLIGYTIATGNDQPKQPPSKKSKPPATSNASASKSKPATTSTQSTANLSTQ